MKQFLLIIAFFSMFIPSIFAKTRLLDLKSESVIFSEDSDQGNNTEDKNKVKRVKLELTGTGALIYPKRKFNDNYKGIAGFEFGINTTFIMTDNKNIKSFPLKKVSLIFFNDNFKLNNKILNSLNMTGEKEASVTGFYIGVEEGFSLYSNGAFMITPFIGSGLGGARLSLKNKTFEQIGKTTYTEIKDENNDFQLYYFSRFGFNILNSTNTTINYSYDLASIEKGVNPIHMIVNNIALSIAEKGADVLIDKTVSAQSIKTRNVIKFITEIGFCFVWDNFDYQYHNWPFDDNTPLKYHKNRISLSYEFR